MPGAGRVGDKAQVQGPGCAHGCPACPHPAVGPGLLGSPTVFINGRFALRVDDIGMHAVCCGMNMWTAKMGAPTVKINGKQAYRMNDMGQSCGGMTKLIEGSADVIIGESAGGGGGGVGGGGGGGAGGGSSSQAARQSSSSQGSSAAGSSTASDGGRGSGFAQNRGTAAAATSSTAAPVNTPLPPAEPEHQLEVQLVDRNGKPQENVRYQIELPDGTVKKGRTDGQGWIRISGLKQTGDAKLTLPDLDGDAS